MYFRFSSVGIKPGDILSSTLDASIQATVLDDRHIQLANKKTSMSGATLEILRGSGKNPKSVRGTAYWTFQGQKLTELMIEAD